MMNYLYMGLTTNIFRQSPLEGIHCVGSLFSAFHTWLITVLSGCELLKGAPISIFGAGHRLLEAVLADHRSK